MTRFLTRFWPWSVIDKFGQSSGPDCPPPPITIPERIYCSVFAVLLPLAPWRLFIIAGIGAQMGMDDWNSEHPHDRYSSWNITPQLMFWFNPAVSLLALLFIWSISWRRKP